MWSQHVHYLNGKDLFQQRDIPMSIMQEAISVQRHKQVPNQLLHNVDSGDPATEKTPEHSLSRRCSERKCEGDHQDGRG